MTIISATRIPALSESTFRKTQYEHNKAWVDDNIDRSEGASTYSDAHIKDVDGEGYESRKDLYVNDLGHNLWCKPELLELMLEVRKAIPGVDFLVHSGCFDARANRINRVSVYRKGDNLTMGTLSFSTTYSLSGGRISRTHDNKGQPLKQYYIVQSPYIDNPKYRFTSDGSFSRVASSVAGALKNAKKYLRSYTPLNLAVLTAPDFRPTSYKRRITIEIEIGEVLRGLPPTSRLVEEIYRLANEGGSMHQNAALHRGVKEYMDLQAQYEEVTGRLIPTAFVVIGAQGDAHVLGLHISPSGGMDTWGMIYRYASTNDLPDELLGAVSVLSMMDKRKSVDGVGRKVSDTLYWVELEKGVDDICV